MEHFTPLASTLGGLLIGAAAALVLLATGRIAGISGIAGGVLRREAGDTSWRVFFVLGLMLAGILIAVTAPERLAFGLVRSKGALVVSGLLVGLGTRLGGGCTSGHGVCGVGRLSKRSMVATLTFMGSAAVTTYVVNHLLGGSL